jgi:CRISPR-associated protein (TIGR03984 family)
MSRIICKDLCQDLSTAAIEDDSTLRSWLIEQAATYKLTYLLAHADDGVIWGNFNEGKLTIARDIFPQFSELRLYTLQQCRVFGTSGEVLLWRTAQGWKARLITDPLTETEDTVVEDQVLWGTQGKEKDGFTLLSDGQQELYHVVPLTNIQFDDSKRLHHPVRLKVKHYIEYDENGLARIGLSRLVDLFAESKEK